MVLYEIFSHNIKCKYKTSICSKATLVISLINFITIVLPFILAYRTQGLWLKTDTYREQPQVHFKYEYFFMLETKKIDEPIICTTFKSLYEVTEESNKCYTITVREEDYNRDGLNDRLYFAVESSLPPYLDVYKVNFILLFDYKLYSYSRFQMETAGMFEASTSLGASKLELIGDLRLNQRQPLRHMGLDFRYNTSLQMELFSPYSFMKQYSQRNVTTRIKNVYMYWTRGRSQEDPFHFSLILNIPEETIVYTPGFWQVAKMAWVQYMSLFFISLLISKRLKHFILDNRLVHNVKFNPLKKPF